MDFFEPHQFRKINTPGVDLVHLLSPHNASAARVILTSVTMAPGAVQERHSHARAEQVWIAMEGDGVLLLADGATRAFGRGQVARFEEGDIHGFENTGAVPFVYLAVTSPRPDAPEAPEPG